VAEPEAPNRTEMLIHFMALGVIVLVGVALRLTTIAQPMRYDESVTFLLFASKPLGEALSYYPVPNNHLFHTLWVHVAYLLGGNHPWVLRLPALVAGVMLIPAVYLAVRALFDRHAGLLAAALAAASSPLVLYSTNARGYTLLLLIWMLLLAVATRLPDRQGRGGWAAFAVLATLGFYTMPLMIYPFAIVAVWIALRILLEHPREERQPLVKNELLALCIAGAMTVLLYLPVVLRSGLRALVANKFVRPESWSAFVSALPEMLQDVWSQWTTAVPWPVQVLLVAGFALSLVCHRHWRVPLVPVAVACVVAMVLVQRVLGWPRFWLFLLPLYLGSASAGLSWLGGRLPVSVRRNGGVLVACGAVVLAGWLGTLLLQSGSAETGRFPEAEAVASYLKDHLQPGEAVVISIPCDWPVKYYLQRQGAPVESVNDGIATAPRVFVLVHEGMAQTLPGVLANEGLDASQWRAERRVKRFASSSLWEVRKPGQ